MSGKYRTIVADPPWQYGNEGGKAQPGRGHARWHYETLSPEEMHAMPVADMAEDQAHLWLWGVNGLLDVTYGVARAWGFRPVSLLTWCKAQPGVGRYIRNNTEHVLLAVRGKAMDCSTPALKSWWEWPRTKHSAKPDAFYDLVEKVSPGPYLELFARRARFGWDYWGDESLQTVELVP